MVSVRNVAKRFGDNQVLNGVSLEIVKGEILALMGSSGGGKTTLLRCIAGLIKPDSGSVTIDGINVHEEPDRARMKLGLVFQASALFDYLNVRENVLFGVRRQSRHSKKELDQIAGEMLETVGLEHAADLLPGELSGGMKKRVGMARALAMRPEVMLYDEPITGLDPITAYTIDRLIVDLGDRYNVTSLVVSHDITSVFRISDRIAYLDDGKLVFTGTTDEFSSSGNEEITEILRKAQSRTLVEGP